MRTLPTAALASALALLAPAVVEAAWSRAATITPPASQYSVLGGGTDLAGRATFTWRTSDDFDLATGAFARDRAADGRLGPVRPGVGTVGVAPSGEQVAVAVQGRELRWRERAGAGDAWSLARLLTTLPDGRLNQLLVTVGRGGETVVAFDVLRSGGPGIGPTNASLFLAVRPAGTKGFGAPVEVVRGELQSS